MQSSALSAASCCCTTTGEERSSCWPNWIGESKQPQQIESTVKEPPQREIHYTKSTTQKSTTKREPPQRESHRKERATAKREPQQRESHSKVRATTKRDPLPHQVFSSLAVSQPGVHDSAKGHSSDSLCKVGCLLECTLHYPVSQHQSESRYIVHNSSVILTPKQLPVFGSIVGPELNPTFRLPNSPSMLLSKNQLLPSRDAPPSFSAA